MDEKDWTKSFGQKDEMRHIYEEIKQSQRRNFSHTFLIYSEYVNFTRKSSQTLHFMKQMLDSSEKYFGIFSTENIAKVIKIIQLG